MNGLIAATKAFMEKYYEDNNDLLEYLFPSIDDTIIRLKIAVERRRIKDI